MILNRVTAVIWRHFIQIGRLRSQLYVKLTVVQRLWFWQCMTRDRKGAHLFEFYWKTDPPPSFQYSTCARLRSHLSNS